MQLLGLLLTLINVLTVAGPTIGVAVVYQSNLTELIIPQEVTQALNDTLTVTQQTNLAQIVNAEFDNTSRTVTLTVDFTNPVDDTLELKAFTGNVECATHGFTFGQANLGNEVALPPQETTQIIVTAAWTEDSENHLQAEHSEASTIDINITNLTVNINDVTTQLSDPVTMPNVPIT
ncbi:MAG: hypothetical protein ACE14S_01990 [Candidatus Bathyarchaeia archaeon]